MPDSTKHLVLQMDYNGKRHGEPDAWHWLDFGVLRGNTRDAHLADARAHVKRSGTSKFIRGWRVVERTTVITDEVIEELSNG